MLSDEDLERRGLPPKTSGMLSGHSITKKYILISPLEWGKVQRLYPSLFRGFLHPGVRDHLELLKALEQGAQCSPKGGFPPLFG